MQPSCPLINDSYCAFLPCKGSDIFLQIQKNVYKILQSLKKITFFSFFSITFYQLR